ncbi:hypothetical protein [Streptomyces sp. NPDC000983]|uniref:hypothetical protein n=1 Tax=Streptomyces sp. NPDC000983 TaxID=3154373 RepID=UPI00331FF489
MTSVTWASDVTDAAGAVGAIAAVVVGIAAIYWGYRANVPRRRAEYTVEITPLLTGGVSDVTVYRGGQRLAHPHTMTLKLTNVGHGEFEAAHFNDRPVEFALGSRIVAKLGEETGDHRRVPPADFTDDTLYVRPHVIHKGQQITYKLLLDGPNPVVTPRHSLSGELRVQPWATKVFKLWLAGIVLVAACLWTGTLWAQAEAEEQTRSKVQEIVEASYRAGMHAGHQMCRQLPDGCATQTPAGLGTVPEGLGRSR